MFFFISRLLNLFVHIKVNSKNHFLAIGKPDFWPHYFDDASGLEEGIKIDCTPNPCDGAKFYRDHSPVLTPRHGKNNIASAAIDRLPSRVG